MKTTRAKPMTLQRLRKELRQAVADYMYSEGCACCRGSDHKEHATVLAKLLNVPAHPEQPDWHDFSPYRSAK